MNARAARVLLVTVFAVYLAVMVLVIYQASHHHQYAAVIGGYALNILVGVLVGRAYVGLR